MKIKHTYKGLGTTLLFILLLQTVNTWAAPYISFSSNRIGNYDIYVMDINGENLQNLTNHPSWDSQPTWAPNGSAFAFVSNRDGNSEIYIMKLNGTEPQRLTNHPALDSDPTWSPDGKWIAFRSRRHRAPDSDIYKIDIKGENLQQLTNKGKYNIFPAWSPDGEQIVFYSYRNNIGNIYVMDANGKRLRRVVSGGSPCWSPDGQHIAYTVGLMGIGIYITDVNGQDQRRVTPNNIWSHNPAWSPDGTWIAYDAEIENPWGNPNVDTNIYLISVDGGKPRQITKHPGKNEHPEWVPEGFLSVSPSAEKQIMLWGTLKQPEKATK